LQAMILELSHKDGDVVHDYFKAKMVRASATLRTCCVLLACAVVQHAFQCHRSSPRNTVSRAKRRHPMSGGFELTRLRDRPQSRLSNWA
jgi:hypothetical protein